MANLYPLAAPLLARIDPERAHGLTLAALRLGLAAGPPPRARPELEGAAFGRRFANPLGLAAGFDKDARAVAPLLRAGFGFVEVGTVTPRPQAGQPRPRLYRLPEDGAAINRMGFNSAGMAAVAARLAGRRDGGPLGVNIGPNRGADDPVADYVACFRRLGPLADYVAINVSSPNTPGLRRLQEAARLGPLLARMAREREALDRRPALLLKLSPDLERGAALEAARLAAGEGFDGLIVSNTSLQRPAGLAGRHRHQAGGLSGRPLFAISTPLLRALWRAEGQRLILVGAGGIDSAQAAYGKIRAGATLLQLYTALAFHGPALVENILDGLQALLARDGYRTLAEAVGADA